MQPDQVRAGLADPARRSLSPAFTLAAALTVCSAMAENAGSQAERTADVSPPCAAAAAPLAAASSPEPARLAPDRMPAEAHPIEIVLRYVDRIRDMPAAALTQEARRLLDTGDSAIRLMQLAAALAQSKVAANTLRAQALLHRVLGQDDAEASELHPLARLMSAQLAESRRADEQIERQSQQLRDAQRRIAQLNERLEAVRAIERSLPSPASAVAPATAPARP
jgi:hypothetical protein